MELSRNTDACTKEDIEEFLEKARPLIVNSFLEPDDPSFKTPTGFVSKTMAFIILCLHKAIIMFEHYYLLAKCKYYNHKLYIHAYFFFLTCSHPFSSARPILTDSHMDRTATVQHL